jgi:hypothetical protein
MSNFVKHAGALVALAICSACAGASTVAPSSAALSGGYTTAAHPNLSALTRYPTILPDRRAKSKKFEYIINDYGTYAGIFDYPKSDKQIGTLNNVGGQACTNVLYGYGKKFIWIVAGGDLITEFQVPRKLIGTLSSPYGVPSSCAMDIGGDLAVGILYGSGGGDVVIFKNARGSGKIITTPLSEEYFDGYDNKGNLFADGFNNSGFELVELRKGGSKFKEITTSNSVEFPGSVQWDGTYLTITDQDANAMYRYTVNGTKATLKGTVSFSGSGDCSQTWIAIGVVYCADASNEDGEVFKYPAGGSPIAVFTGEFDVPLGTVAAEK